MSKFASLSYFDLAELFRKSKSMFSITMGHIINLDTCMFIVTSFNGSDRLKHVPYHGVQHIVIYRSPFCFFYIKFEWVGVVI